MDDREKAKTVDLYSFLVAMYPDMVKQEGNWLKLKANKSVHVKKGSNCYTDFQKEQNKWENGKLTERKAIEGAHGDNIDFCRRFLDKTYKKAIKELANYYDKGGAKAERKTNKFCYEKLEPDIIPIEYNGNDNIREYLLKRGIESQIMDALIDMGMIYESHYKGYPNIVFTDDKLNPEYLEVSGIGKKRFKGCYGKGACYWLFVCDGKAITRNGKPIAVVVTEAPVDTMSLCEIINEFNTDKVVAYASTGGAEKYGAFQRLIDEFGADRVYICTDNDESGQKTRDKYKECKYLKPKNKDWNEDVLYLHEQFREQKGHLEKAVILNKYAMEHLSDAACLLNLYYK